MEDVVLKWGPVIIMLVSLVFTISSSRGKANNDRVSKIEERLDEIEDVAHGVAGELKHLPGRDVTHRLELVIAELNLKIGVMDERLKPVAEMARRVHDRFFEEVRP